MGLYVFLALIFAMYYFPDLLMPKAKKSHSQRKASAAAAAAAKEAKKGDSPGSAEATALDFASPLPAPHLSETKEDEEVEAEDESEKKDEVSTEEDEIVDEAPWTSDQDDAWQKLCVSVGEKRAIELLEMVRDNLSPASSSPDPHKDVVASSIKTVRAAMPTIDAVALAVPHFDRSPCVTVSMLMSIVRLFDRLAGREGVCAMLLRCSYSGCVVASGTLGTLTLLRPDAQSAESETPSSLFPLEDSYENRVENSALSRRERQRFPDT
jgi:hypothetical protein